jgi:uncharacterized membrane protein YphA (DoxX/SURF4 family)
MSFRGTKFNQIPTSNQFNTQQPQFPQQGGDWKQKFDAYSKKVENLVDHPSLQQIKPYIPQIGRFLIVATFYEDAIRLISQWSDQAFYLWNYRHIPYFFVIVLLIFCIIVMLSGSTLIIMRKHQLYASGALIFILLLQGLMYGLFVNSSFILRNLSLIGGLLIALSDTLVKEKKRFAGLPEIHSNNSYKNYVLLAGRVMLVLMFFSFAATKSWFVTIITLIGIGSIAAGYKTKFASVILITILTFYNFTQNSYWNVKGEAKKDYQRYEFYQTLSIIGGLLLVVNTGAGELSIDEKKKIY